MKRLHVSAGLAFAIIATLATARADDALLSWNDGPAKQAMIEFVQKTTVQGIPNFVPPHARIADA